LEGKLNSKGRITKKSKNKVTKQCNEKNSILIDSFNKIREIVRIIYIYSSYNNNEIFNVSERKLRSEKHRIKNIFEENCKDNYEKNRKYVGLCYDAVIYSKNFLSQAYFIKNFHDFDLILYFFILEILNQGPMSMDEILDEYATISYIKGKSSKDDDIVSSTTMERHLKKLLKQGLIERVKDGKRYLYKSKQEFFEDFSLGQKEAILNIANFYSEIAPYKVPGYYLQETLKSDSDIMNLNYYDNEDVYKDWYYFSGNQLHSILDEIVLFNIERNRFVEIEKYEGNKIKACYLYKIIDPIHGRLYVMTRGIDENNLVTDEYIIFRVDKLKSVRALKKKPKNLDDIDLNKRLNMWNCSISPQKTRTLEEETVQAIFYIDETKDRDLYERLLREKKWATLEKIDDGKYLFTISVIETSELVPWFRTFEGHVVILNKNLNKQFQEERDKLLRRYGVFE